MATFAITDGAIPEPAKRGSVLRSVIRRAARFGWQQLGLREPFIYTLVPVLAEAMGDVFPELKKEAARVADVIKEEEVSFGRTLDRGIALFEQAAAISIAKEFQEKVLGSDWEYTWSVSHAVDAETEAAAYTNSAKEIRFLNNQTNERQHFSTEDALSELRKKRLAGGIVISAKNVFKLHDTFGFPSDMTRVMAQERGIDVDLDGFAKLREQAKEVSAGGGGGEDITPALIGIVQQHKLTATEFVGYGALEANESTICLLFEHHGHEFRPVTEAKTGTRLAVVVGRTPFYAESGGQVGDKGTITNETGGVFRVEDTQKIGDVFFHLGVVEKGTLTGGASTTQGVKLHLKLDATRRAKIMSNHTTTHAMNRALRALVSKTADQKGSLVDDTRLRFDFSHNSSVTDEQIAGVEKMVNEDIAKNLPVYTEYAAQEQAIKINSLRAVFGEKYPPKVRVVSIGVPLKDLLAKPENEAWGGYSIEFCGGTHMTNTGDAKAFVIVSEEPVSKGVRRITALTGDAAKTASDSGARLVAQAEAAKATSGDAAALAKSLASLNEAIGAGSLPATARLKARALITELQEIAKEHDKARAKAASGNAVEEARKLAESVNGIVFVGSLDGLDIDALRAAMDVVRKKSPETAVLLGSVAGDKVSFVASVPEAAIKKGLKAGDWVREVAKAAGGGGGGRPDMAQAGGKDPSKLGEALEVGRKFAASKVG